VLEELRLEEEEEEFLLVGLLLDLAMVCVGVCVCLWGFVVDG